MYPIKYPNISKKIDNSIINFNYINIMNTLSDKEMHRGTLYIRIGPMFSGKTSWLNSELTQLADKKFRVLKIIHADDDRQDVEINDNSGSTHNSSYKSLSSKISVIRTSELTHIDIDNFHVIGVDESQFFSEL